MGQVRGVKRIGAQRRYCGMGSDIQASRCCIPYDGRCEVYRQSRTSDDIHSGLPSYSIPFTNNLESEIGVENGDCPIPQGHGEAARGKMEKKRAVSIPGFFLLHLHAFPEPHCSIQPALLLPTSESCPRPGHVTWLAATNTHGDLKRERDI
jgi:hypothetical protein